MHVLKIKFLFVFFLHIFAKINTKWKKIRNDHHYSLPILVLTKINMHFKSLKGINIRITYDMHTSVYINTILKITRMSFIYCTCSKNYYNDNWMHWEFATHAKALFCLTYLSHINKIIWNFILQAVSDYNYYISSHICHKRLRGMTIGKTHSLFTWMLQMHMCLDLSNSRKICIVSDLADLWRSVLIFSNFVTHCPFL